MSEFELSPTRDHPSIPEIGGDGVSHTRAMQVLRENVMVGARHTGNLLSSFVRVSELIELGIAELQGGRLVVRTTYIQPSMTTAERNALKNPQNGLIIYNTTAGQFQGRAAGAWVAL